MGKRIGYGSLLGVDTAGGSSYTDLGEIIDFSLSAATRTEVETSVLADTYKTYAPGQIDPGTCTLTVAYDPEATTSQTLVDLLEQRTPVPTWQITYSVIASSSEAAPTETFSGWVMSVSREGFAEGDRLQSSVEVRITGDAGLTGSA